MNILPNGYEETQIMNLKELTLGSAEFGQDHCFHFSSEVVLEPSLSGFNFVFKGQTLRSKLNEKEALRLVSCCLNSEVL